MNAENENKHKTKELQLYEVYNHAFEESINAIQMRQHEFENHINAIKCMKYTIVEQDELLVAQDEYCEKILKENKINKLLNINLEPVIRGFLYSKILSASEMGILSRYNIENIDIKRYISIVDFVEVIGILFDNAVEALEHEDEKILIIKIYHREGALCLEVLNRSRVFLNSEIEKFCEYGYSSKGKNRGIGLARVKDIIHRYQGSFQIQNSTYLENNYLSFRVLL